MASRKEEVRPAAAKLTVRQATSSNDLTAVIDMFRAYTEWLGEDLTFQNYDSELAGLPGKYASSAGGALLIARDATTDEALGCVALRPLQLQAEFQTDSLTQPLCEIKRLFTYPQARGRGVARRLVRDVLAEAEGKGYRHVLLDSLARMGPAQALYRSEGFVEVEPYYRNPLDGVTYLGRALRPKAET